MTFLVLFLGSLGFLVVNFYLGHTKPVAAFGGTYTEGVVGQPRFINPIYGETNDIDRSLIDLVFSGLMTYDKDGNIVKDLAKDYTISDDGKTYTFTLKDNIFWHDGRPLTADDVLFTVKTIQNSDYKSPLRANWIDVTTQKISDNSFSFVLKQPYNSFIENCTLKIIPAHIWQHILAENFTLSLYNLQPIGSGPFAFENLTQTATGFIESVNLKSNRKYHNPPSFIANISFRFFENAEDLSKSINANQVDGFALDSLDKNQSPAFVPYQFSLPRYFAVFFNNQKTSVFSDQNIRKALAYSTDKEALIKSINSTNSDTAAKTIAFAVGSPILPDFYGFAKPATIYEFDTTKASDLLDKAGYKLNAQNQREKTTKKQAAFQFTGYLKVGSKNSEVTSLQACLARLDESFKSLLASEVTGTYGTGTETAVTEFQKKYLPSDKPTGETGVGTRKKLNELCTNPQNTQGLAFTLTTINQPQLLDVANSLKDYWQAMGVQVTVQAVNITDLKPIIKNRSYDALLYGETLGMEPDIYPFWYSSQKIDPGLNLSSYESKDADTLLKDARQTLDKDRKKQDLEKLQNIITADAPALFLYNPTYLYWAANNLKGVDTQKIADPAKRFVNITNWYLKTKRIWN